jgi:hypothetical protein
MSFLPFSLFYYKKLDKDAKKNPKIKEKDTATKKTTT